MGTGFDGDRLVDDIAFDARAGCQANFQTADLADDPAVDDHVVSHDFAVNRGAFAHGKEVRMDVALDFAFDLNIAARADITLDLKVR